jgi:hypothetical protein
MVEFTLELRGKDGLRKKREYTEDTIKDNISFEHS